jgi:hypothetical protein
MRKFDLIHTTILIIGLLAGYWAISSLIAMLSFAGYISDIFVSSRSVASQLIRLLANLIIPAIACVVLIRNGKRCATAILKNEPGAIREDAPKIDLDRNNLVFVLLVGLGLSTLIQSLPHALVDAYQLFGNKVAPPQYGMQVTDKGTLAIDLLKVTFGLFLIYAAPTLTNLIERRGSSKTDGE